jgi:hypothetical protein
MNRDELQKRKDELKQIVHADIVRREVMQFRLEPDNIEKLYRIAANKRKPVGTLVREWITDRINSELNEDVSSSDQTNTSPELINAVYKLREELQKPLDELNKRMCVFESLANKLEQSQNK